MTTEQAKVRVIASQKTWIEGEAVQQLEGTARLPGMRAAIGMPDLHPGKGSPIGAAFLCEGRVYPHLVGNDIGCGMGLWATDLQRRKAKRDRWAERLGDLDGPWDGDTAAALAEVGTTEFDASLGTIGGGNHFAELQSIDRVDDAAALAGGRRNAPGAGDAGGRRGGVGAGQSVGDRGAVRGGARGGAVAGDRCLPQQRGPGGGLLAAS